MRGRGDLGVSVERFSSLSGETAGTAGSNYAQVGEGSGNGNLGVMVSVGREQWRGRGGRKHEF